MATMLYQGHGSYRFVLENGTVVYVDPFAGEGYDLPADLILCTHEHFDHTAVDKMPHAQGCTIIRAADLHPYADTYLKTSLHGVGIQAVQACNTNHPIEDCVGFVLRFDGIVFYASGDTSKTPDMENGKLASMGIDYAVFPCDGVYNMDRAQASVCADLVKAKHSIPIHMVPMNDPSDSSQLFDQSRAEEFEAEGRMIVAAGESIFLV